METNLKTTNYYNAFIEPAEDSKATTGIIPEVKGDKKTVASIEYEMLINKPYHYTSDDVLFTVYAVKNSLKDEELQQERTKFFSKGQPCFRASPLTKTFGWGVHFNEQGKMALYGINTKEYQGFLNDKSLQHYKAMRSKKAEK